MFMAVSLVTRDAGTARVPVLPPRRLSCVLATVRSTYCGDRLDGLVLEKPQTRAGSRASMSGCFLHGECAIAPNAAEVGRKSVRVGFQTRTRRRNAAMARTSSALTECSIGYSCHSTA